MPQKQCIQTTRAICTNEACACIDGVLTTVQYGLYTDTGEYVGWYLDTATGELITSPEWMDCCGDCSCTSAPFCVRGFDYQDLTTWEAGSMEWVTPAGTSVDQPSAQDNGFKSSWYINLIANVNSNPGWTMSVINDVASDNSGPDDKPTFQFIGPCDSTLSIVRQGNDTLTLTVSSEGVMSGTFMDGVTDISSNTFVSCE